MLRISPVLLSILLPIAGIAGQTGQVSVIHGIPGLSSDVDVFANGSKLFSFGYGESKGPLSLAPATYNLEVKLNGTTVLSGSAKVAADKNYTVVAHLKASSGIALSVFENDTSKLSKTVNARVQVRHLAKAPAVDVVARRWWVSKTLFKNVSNGEEGSGEVFQGAYSVSLNAAGTKTRAFGPARLNLRRNKIYAVHAIGELGTRSFRLFTQVLDVATSKPTVKLTTKVRGKSCGGSIGLSTKTPEFGKPFDVVLTGGTRNGSGLLHSGMSDSRFLAFRLPLNLRLLGAPGCTLYQNTTWIQPVSLDANGGAKVTRTIPVAYARYFREMHYQFSFVAKGKNRLGLLLTDYASIERQ